MEVQGSENTTALSDVFSQVVRVSLGDKALEPLTEAQVTFPQFEALRYVQSHAHSSVGDLAAGQKISYPSATNIVARLERKGFLKKKGIRADRRIVRLALTNAGEHLVSEVRSAREKRLADIMQAMRPSERDNFRTALDGFMDAARQCGYAEPVSAVILSDKNGSEACP